MLQNILITSNMPGQMLSQNFLLSQVTVFLCDSFIRFQTLLARQSTKLLKSWQRIRVPRNTV